MMMSRFKRFFSRFFEKGAADRLESERLFKIKNTLKMAIGHDNHRFAVALCQVFESRDDVLSVSFMVTPKAAPDVTVILFIDQRLGEPPYFALAADGYNEITLANFYREMYWSHDALGGIGEMVFND
jgi:hypothetical protein